MRPGNFLTVTAADRCRLAVIAGDRNSPQKHVWRAEIVLLSGDGLGTVEIMRRAGKSKTCVWRWQERFAQEGVEGLWRDKTRPSRVKPLGQEVIDRVVALTATGESCAGGVTMIIKVPTAISPIDPVAMANPRVERCSSV